MKLSEFEKMRRVKEAHRLLDLVDERLASIRAKCEAYVLENQKLAA